MLSLFPPCHTSAFIVLLCCCSTFLSAQGNRDCRDFVVLCGQDEVQFTPGQSGQNDFQNPYNQVGCLGGENSTAWYYFEAIPSTPAGAILEMTIVAEEDRTDYDFAIWGPVSNTSDVSCDSLGSPIRCNYAQGAGPTGLAGMGGRDSELSLGSTFSNALSLEPGVGYFLLIDNYRSDRKSFTFTFERGSEYLNCNLNAETVTLGCGDSFVDAGGSSGNYANNTPYNYQICPTDPTTPVLLTFDAFETEPITPSGCPDLMVVHDGQNATAPVIGDNICGTSVPGPFTATNPSGCLFITFSSNNVRNFPGWEARIACPPVCVPDCTETETLPCDDLDPCTENDVMVLDCDGSTCVPCMGTEVACDVAELRVEACDDGNPNTTRDSVFVRDCDGAVCIECTGRTLDCAEDATERVPCDDRNGCTLLDSLTRFVLLPNSICEPCAGIPQDCDSGTPTLQRPCDDGNLNTVNDQQVILLCDGSICQPCAGEPVDCASSPSNPRPCDDGNPCTENDVEIVLSANGTICVPCAGTPLDCATDGAIEFMACDDGDVNTINDRQLVLRCDGSVCQPCAGESVDCASNPSSPRPCDDGNPCTENDTEIALDANGTICTPCAGTPIDCATEGATTVVRSCDDGIANTVNDVETILPCSGEVCIPCAGVPTSCSGDSTTTRACDDGDRCTIDDVEVVLASDGSICEPCAGIPQDCADGATTFRPCDDGNVRTTDDVEAILDCDGSICAPCAGVEFCPEWVAVTEVVTAFAGGGVSCAGERDASIAVTSSASPFAPYRYVWSTGDTLARVDELGAGVYTVTVTDATGCPTVDSVTVTEPDSMTLSLQLSPVSCFGSGDGSIVVREVEGGTAPFTYQYSEGRSARPGSLTMIGPGTYRIGVTDANGCRSHTEVAIEEPDELYIDLGADTLIRLGDSLIITPSTNAGGVDSFMWRGVDCKGCPAVTIQPFRTSSVSVTIADEFGCLAEDDLSIEVDERPLIYVPNAFSPNGDKVNDVLFPFADESVAQVTLFQVFDRWGERVWAAENFVPNDPAFGWDGTLAGRPLNSAVFVYSLEVVKIDGSRASLGGDFILMR